MYTARDQCNGHRQAKNVQIDKCSVSILTNLNVKSLGEQLFLGGKNKPGGWEIVGVFGAAS